MNVYILEIDAKIKDEAKGKKIASSLAKWDGESSIYFNNSNFFNLCSDCSKSTIFFNKKEAIKQSKFIYKHDYSKLIIEKVKILTINLKIALPLDIRYSQIIKR